MDGQHGWDRWITSIPKHQMQFLYSKWPETHCFSILSIVNHSLLYPCPLIQFVQIEAVCLLKLDSRLTSVPPGLGQVWATDAWINPIYSMALL